MLILQSTEFNGIGTGWPMTCSGTWRLFSPVTSDMVIYIPIKLICECVIVCRAAGAFDLQPRAAGPAGVAVLRDVPAPRGAARARRAAGPRAGPTRRRRGGQRAGGAARAVSIPRGDNTS